MNQNQNMNQNQYMNNQINDYKLTIGNEYRVIGFSDINSENPSNIHDDKVDHLCANTFNWETLNVELTYKEEIEHAGYTYNIFKTNYLRNQDGDIYLLENQRELSFIKMNDNTKDYSIFSFKPIFEEIQN
jgi:hypothetical protein